VASTAEGRVAIHELIALHGHLFDAGALDRLDELFTEDVVYDVEALGGGRLHGITAIRDAAQTLGDQNPLGRHTTNVVARRRATMLYACTRRVSASTLTAR